MKKSLKLDVHYKLGNFQHVPQAGKPLPKCCQEKVKHQLPVNRRMI